MARPDSRICCRDPTFQYSGKGNGNWLRMHLRGISLEPGLLTSTAPWLQLADEYLVRQSDWPGEARVEVLFRIHRDSHYRGLLCVLPVCGDQGSDA